MRVGVHLHRGTLENGPGSRPVPRPELPAVIRVCVENVTSQSAITGPRSHRRTITARASRHSGPTFKGKIAPIKRLTPGHVDFSLWPRRKTGRLVHVANQGPRTPQSHAVEI